MPYRNFISVEHKILSIVVYVDILVRVIALIYRLAYFLVHIQSITPFYAVKYGPLHPKIW